MSHPAIARSYRLFVVGFVVVTVAFIVKTYLDFSWSNVILTAVVLGANVMIIRALSRGIVGATREPERLPCPPHLRVMATERGFGHFPPLPNNYGNADDISVSESSNAEYAGIWLRVKSPNTSGEITANLTAGTAWRLAEQLALLVANHYHGDQRPDSNETILSVDTSRLDTREVVDHG